VQCADLDKPSLLNGELFGGFFLIQRLGDEVQKCAHVVLHAIPICRSLAPMVWKKELSSREACWCFAEGF